MRELTDAEKMNLQAETIFKQHTGKDLDNEWVSEGVSLQDAIFEELRRTYGGEVAELQHYFSGIFDSEAWLEDNGYVALQHSDGTFFIFEGEKE